MLVALGLQIATASLPRLGADLVASAVRLIGGPALALAAPIGIKSIARSTGVL
jgi:hypothetical protein